MEKQTTLKIWKLYMSFYSDIISMSEINKSAQTFAVKLIAPSKIFLFSQLEKN